MTAVHTAVQQLHARAGTLQQMSSHDALLRTERGAVEPLMEEWKQMLRGVPLVVLMVLLAVPAAGQT